MHPTLKISPKIIGFWYLGIYRKRLLCVLECVPKNAFLTFSFRRTGLARAGGLGMSIVKEIVLDHDGEISVETSQGVGTVLRVQLHNR